MSLAKLSESIKKIQTYKRESEKILASARDDNKQLTQDNKKWRETYRLNTVAVSSFVASQLCRLENLDFNVERRKIAYFGAAAACISDDIIDKNPEIDPRAFRFLDGSYNSNESNSGNTRLFYLFHSEMERLLPQSFATNFKNLIAKYNQFQELAGDLRKDISQNEVLNIKNGTGGYPILLLHRMMHPSDSDIQLGFSPDYDLEKNILPKTKEQAIFNYGALVSRVDDLDDLKWDLRDSRKSLATEGLVSWRSLKNDVDYVSEGLKKFYSESDVNNVMDFYSTPWMHVLSTASNLVARAKEVIQNVSL